MEVAQLVLDYLRVLVWPTTVLLLVWGFRAKLRELLDRIESARGGGIGVELTKKVKEALTDGSRAPQERVETANEIMNQLIRSETFKQRAERRAEWEDLYDRFVKGT